MNKALFLDRDGVVNREINYLYKIEDFEFMDGIGQICRFFQKQRYLIFIITNQSGIGRGYYSLDDYHRLTNWMLAEFKKMGITISKVYFCPHHPQAAVEEQYRIKCECRKPKAQNFLNAQRTFDLDLTKSLNIGDKESDIEAGINAGVKTNILLKGNKITDYKNTRADLVIDHLIELKDRFP